LVIAPTAERPGEQSSWIAPYGYWRLLVASTRAAGVPVDVWIERDDAIFDPPTDRQSRFVVRPTLDPADEYDPSQPVTKQGTHTSCATTTWVYATGGYVRPTVRDSSITAQGESPLLASYSAAGSNTARPGRINQPDFLAPVHDADVLLGRNAAGSRQRCWVRRDGTSVAAPQAARQILNAALAYDAGAPISAVNVAGERGDGLSPGGEGLQYLRTGLGLVVAW